ncbi:sigma-70 family RNA polymerase sigma factor [Pedobacter sp. PAMC26386]|nr:sigma-70 family RNA polymerase sigma factor [Pedobacter sp. PAMC26386]
MEVLNGNLINSVEKMSWAEDELFSHIKAGNKNAFEQLYRDHSGGVYYNLRRLTRNDELAKELLQDVFTRVWEKKAALNPEKPFHFYLFRMARNSVVNLYRQTKRDKQLMDNLRLLTSEVTHQPVESQVSEAEEEALIRAVQMLPPQRRKIFMLCKLEGKSYEEVSGLLGITTSTIGDHIVKGTKAIRNHLMNSDRILLLFGFSLLIKGDF